MHEKIDSVKEDIRRNIDLMGDLSTSRTILASERTLLAYIRTGLTAIVVGVSLMKFFDEPLVKMLGWLCIPAGIGLVFVGVVRHKKRKVLIKHEEQIVRNEGLPPGLDM